MSPNILTDKEIMELLEEDSSLKSEAKSEPKDAFVDTINPYKYIELDSNALAFDRVHRALNRNLKMTLIYGAPGTGKSMFLSRLNNDLIAQRKNSILISSPILNEEQLFQTISFEIFRDSHLNTIPKGFDELIETISKEREFMERLRPIILLDEAQLYSNQTLEKIRLIADSQAVRVIFAVHKLKEENIFTKEHFKSRIWERIELTNASINELKVYIQKKLMGISMLSLANQFSKRVVRRIHQITNGNYRVTNNLLYAYFNNYPQIWKLQFGQNQLIVRIREIEITAIQIGFIKPQNSLITDIRHLPTAELIWKRWKFREGIKYTLLFLLPIFIYILFQIFETQEKEEERHISKVTFPPPHQKSIQKPKDGSSSQIEKIEPPLQEQKIEKKEKKEDFQSEKNLETFSKTTKSSEKPIVEIPKINSSRDLKVVEEKRVVENIPLDEIDINRAIFKKPLHISPIVNLVDGYSSPDIPKESGYISSLKSQFIQNRSVAVGMKILQFYKNIGDYENIYRYSLELNRLDRNLKKPYLEIEKILLDVGAFEDADKVRDGCQTCDEDL